MSHTMRVSLPGYNALTDTNLDHFALHADEDNVLIKEYARGNFNSSAGQSTTVDHNFGYIPFYMVFVKIEGRWIPANFGTFDIYLSAGVTSTQLIIYTAVAVEVKYYLFYDNFL